MARMGKLGTREYVGSAFVTFGRPASDQFKVLVEANLGPPPREFKGKGKDAVQWLRPGITGRVRHLRGGKAAAREAGRLLFVGETVTQEPHAAHSYQK